MLKNVMFNAKTLSVIIVLLMVTAAEEVAVEGVGQLDKRRLPDNFERGKWTTTTVKPDEVYIEPIGDIKGEEFG